MDNLTEALPAEEVKRIRNKHNLTQEEFAERVKVDKMTVFRWENNERACKGRYKERVLSFDQEWTKRETTTNGKVQVTIDFNNLENLSKSTAPEIISDDKQVIIKEIHIINNVNNLYLQANKKQQ